uniref:Uncharacterized protein n=1 Tax=Anguilla anguilla TaxID=7936 RepID=A0A0E9U5D8_ANGAN
METLWLWNSCTGVTTTELDTSPSTVSACLMEAYFQKQAIRDFCRSC